MKKLLKRKKERETKLGKREEKRREGEKGNRDNEEDKQNKDDQTKEKPRKKKNHTKLVDLKDEDMEGKAGEECMGDADDDKADSVPDDGISELLNEDEGEEDTQELLKKDDVEIDEDSDDEREVGEGEAGSQCVVPVAP